MEQKTENIEIAKVSKTEGDFSRTVDSTGGKSDAGRDGYDSGHTDLRGLNVVEQKSAESDKTKAFDNEVSEKHNQVELINCRPPRNCEYAGDTYPLEKLSPDLQEKYPESVKFNEKGFPDFSPYAAAEVKIQYSGDRATDYKLANEAAGLDVKPKDYTWHHHEDAKTMQLVPRDLHREVGHTGGCATSGLDYNK